MARIAGQICEIMYRILTNASIRQSTGTVFHWCASIYVASLPTCPSHLAAIGQTSNICTKLINVQVGYVQTWILTDCMRALMLLA